LSVIVAADMSRQHYGGGAGFGALLELFGLMD
jgi:hypothetical protein